MCVRSTNVDRHDVIKLFAVGKTWLAGHVHTAELALARTSAQLSVLPRRDVCQSFCGSPPVVLPPIARTGAIAKLARARIAAREVPGVAGDE